MRGGALTNAIHILSREAPQHPGPFHGGTIQREICHLVEGPIQPCWYPDLRTLKNQLLLLINYSVSGIWLQLLKWTKTKVID